jgi:hypothetical protein
MSSVSTALRDPRSVAAMAARGRHRLVRRALRWTATVSVASAMVVGVTTPAQAAGATYIGAAGDVAGMAAATGQPQAVHAYSKFSQSPPTNADMISVQSSGTWRQVAAAGPGSAIYNDIVRWAKAIKSRPGPVMIAYHHEPEAAQSTSYGGPADFIAAYRHVVSIFNAQGATNVEWTLQMTAYSYRAKASDPRAVAKWYPGDPYVDNVGGDGYSWNGCEGHGGATPVSALAGPIVSFAKAHGKKASLPEFGVAPSAGRAQWLRDLHSYLKANRTMTAVFYFHNGPLNKGDSCTWLLRTSAEFDAYGDIARDTAFFRS